MTGALNAAGTSLDEAPLAAERTPRPPRRISALREFVATENASAVFLLAATVTALVWANSPWSASYERLWATELGVRAGSHELVLDARHWLNDGLMALFFLVAGLEIRRELDMGELRERRRVATPVLAAVGGMVMPVLVYLAVNAGEPSVRGWGIAMGTDTAFALGVLALVGGAAPRTRTFLLTLVIVDDAVALTVIAVAYTEDPSIVAIAVGVALFGLMLVLRRAGVRHGAPYFLVGAAVWLAALASGVHATIAGVAIGLLATAYPPTRQDLARAGSMWRLFREEPVPELARAASRTVATSVSPNERLQHLFHPWTSFVIVPLFALANAGVEINGDVIERAAKSPVTAGIVAGLVVGKTVGILGATWLSTRLGGAPLTVAWPQLTSAAAVAGIGFTVALLIADISFDGPELEEAKLGILSASVIAAALGWSVVRLAARVPAADSEDRLALPIQDLTDPVEPEVDHIRGSVDAPVVLVEYGDFECPQCGRAEPVVRELTTTFSHDLAFVFRHLPLDEVHEHARLAAEATEAAAAQDRFWEMHDMLFAHQDALRGPDLRSYAQEIGLDIDRFDDDLRQRRHALRVERDSASADDSGAAGTPTFFINGRRHPGRADLRSLTEAVRRELGRTVKR